MLKRPELLAPVGKIESFYAAVENGANAIYVGGKQFSARQFADNLDMAQLKEIVEYGRLRNIKVYVTLNTLIKNDEIDGLVSYIHDLCEIGVDALIIQDFGVAMILRKYFPSMSFHASTQMSAHSKHDVAFLKACGYKRVVLARELLLDEIKTITEAIDIEIEAFVHGALCVSYSGQCLMSGLIGGRSGNRGRCAQPCRLPYALTKDNIIISDQDAPYLMSPKDIQTLDLVPELIGVGIDTFKIEGRMKSPEYVASVTRTYDKYINLAIQEKKYKVDKQDEEELLTIFNRGGFSQGYYTNKGGISMIAAQSPKNVGLEIGEVVAYHPSGEVKIKTNKSLNPGDGIGILTQSNSHVGAGISEKIQAGATFSLRIRGPISQGDSVYLSKDHQLLNELGNSYHKNNRKSLVTGTLKVKLGEPIQLDLEHETGAQISERGDVVCAAKNAPMSLEKLSNQISKFGNTPFETKGIALDANTDIYVPISDLNKLRRGAAQSLTEKILGVNLYDGHGYQRYLEDQVSDENQTIGEKPLTASVRTLEQLQACLGIVQDIYWELEDQSIDDIKHAVELCHENNSKLYMALPHIQRKKDYLAYEEIMSMLETIQLDGYLIRTYGQYETLRASHKMKVIDYTLNVINNQNVKHWESYGVDAVTLSVEMSGDEIQKMRGECLEMVVYGHLPIMTSEQCLVGRYDHCPKRGEQPSGVYQLTDRKDARYPVITNCKLCRMQILSSKPIGLGDRMKQLQALPIHKMRLIFTIESQEKVEDILSWYTDDLARCEDDHNSGYFIKGVE